jgi:hypothetical protein
VEFTDVHDPGAVDEDVDGSASVYGLLYGGPIGDIERGEGEIAGRRCLIGDDDMCSFAVERLRDGETDAGGATGDEGALA